MLKHSYTNCKGNAFSNRVPRGGLAVERAEWGTGRGGDGKLYGDRNAGIGTFSSMNRSFPLHHSWAAERAVQKHQTLQNVVSIPVVSTERTKSPL